MFTASSITIAPKRSMLPSSSIPTPSGVVGGVLRTYAISPENEKKEEKKIVLRDQPEPDYESLVYEVPRTAESKRLKLSRPIKVGSMKSPSMSKLGQIYRMVLGSSSTLQSSGGGFITQTYAVSLVAGTSDFTSLANIFDEFFVEKMHLHYQPASRYNVLTGGTAGTNEQSLPLGVISLFHDTGVFSTIADMASAVGFKYHNSSDPFKHTWVNNEDYKTGVVVTDSTSATTPSQGWCLTSTTPASNYAGLVQCLSPTISGLPGTAYLGTIVLKWDVLYRQRS